MKLLFMLFCSMPIFTQEVNKLSCELYYCSLQNRIFSDDTPLMVTFDFEISLSLMESLQTQDLLNEKKKTVFKRVLMQRLQTNSVCNSVKDFLIEKRTLSKQSESEDYLRLSYSVPIPVNSEKAYLIVGIDRIRKNRIGVAGAVIMETYRKKPDSWIYEENIILESY